MNTTHMRSITTARRLMETSNDSCEGGTSLGPAWLATGFIAGVGLSAALAHCSAGTNGRLHFGQRRQNAASASATAKTVAQSGQVASRLWAFSLICNAVPMASFALDLFHNLLLYRLLQRVISAPHGQPAHDLISAHLHEHSENETETEIAD